MSYLCTICQQQYEYREATTATDSGWYCACATSRAIKPDTHSLEMEVKRLQQENDELKARLSTIRKVAIHNHEGNCVVPSDLIREVKNDE